MSSIRIYDNTQVSGHRTCNRKHFFRHPLDMNRPGGSPPLAFGLGWHSAMDVIYSNITSLSDQKEEEQILDLAQSAYSAWETRWVEEGFPTNEDMTPDLRDSLKARTPDTAVEMILSYILTRWDDLRYKYELVAIEQPFVVPLDPDDPNLWYSGRLDKVIKHRGKYWIVDHKTTSMYAVKGDFQRSFLDGFTPNSQMDGYAYGASLLYGDDFGGVFIDGALVHKNHHDKFSWFPVLRTQSQLDAWLWETREEIRRIEHDKAIIGDLSWSTPGSEGETSYLQLQNPELSHLSYLPAAPKNTGSCWNFNSPCTYSELCKSWGNPLSGLSEHGLPLGYEINHWSPFDDNQRAEVESLIKEFHKNA